MILHPLINGLLISATFLCLLYLLGVTARGTYETFVLIYVTVLYYTSRFALWLALKLVELHDTINEHIRPIVEKRAE